MKKHPHPCYHCPAPTCEGCPHLPAPPRPLGDAWFIVAFLLALFALLWFACRTDAQWRITKPVQKKNGKRLTCAHVACTMKP